MPVLVQKNTRSPWFGARGTLSVQLTWRPPAGLHKGVDVDLACLYDSHRRQGVVQALGERFGRFDGPPFVELDHDDRTGNSGGERLAINLGAASSYSKMLVFAYIYEGATSWEGFEAAVTFTAPGGHSYSLRLDNPQPGATHCALALIRGGQQVQVTYLCEYFNNSHAGVARKYGWGGLTWQTTRKPR